MQATSGASLTAEGDPSRSGLALLLVGAAVAWAADGATKVAAVDALTDRRSVEVLPGVLDLALTRNPGAAFSLGTGFTTLLTLVALTVVAMVLRLAVRVRSRVWAIGLGLLLGGALGNLTDRMLREPGPFRGHVVDFLRLPHWPVFNLADSWIVVAAAVIAVQSVRGVGLDGSRHQEPG
ncbi:MAG: signal peptidase II [Actinomycetota bacterium]|nr:signal peptidase II [Actinomycetota bacterium]